MNKLLLVIAAAGLTTTMAGRAWAEDCVSLQTQAEMNACVGKDARQADAQLNRMYGQIQQRLKGDPATAKLLTAAQRAWIAYRDAECEFSSANSVGGTIHGMVTALCTTRLTEKRIDDFKAYLNCREGDTACPVPRR